MKTLLLGAAVLLAVTPAFGQRKMSMAKNQTVRVKGQSSIFITYDHTGKREPLHVNESSKGVWLRLHNNTHAAIFLPSFTVPRSRGDVNQPQFGPQPRLDFVNVKFEVDGKQKRQNYKIFLYLNNQVIEPLLVSGGFLVPPELKDQEYVDVRFKSARYDLFFQGIYTSKFQTDWTFGVDTKPFDSENASEEEAKNTAIIRYINFESRVDDDTRLVVRELKPSPVPMTQVSAQPAKSLEHARGNSLFIKRAALSVWRFSKTLLSALSFGEGATLARTARTGSDRSHWRANSGPNQDLKAQTKLDLKPARQ